MRDLNTLLNSLVNVDRKSLIAILMSEAEKAEHQVRFSRHRTGTQREKHRAVIELLARIRQVLSFLWDGQIASEMIDSDIRSVSPLRKSCGPKGPGKNLTKSWIGCL
jgi:hypothetical protein